MASLGHGLLSWAVTAWSQRIDDAVGHRITPLVFGARGVVPMGYAAFAFALGVMAGMLIRRTFPAMAVVLALYIAAAAVPQWPLQWVETGILLGAAALLAGFCFWWIRRLT